MPRKSFLNEDQWAEARVMRESGATITSIAKCFGIDRAAVSRRAKREGWSNCADVAEVIRRKVTEKSHGIVTADPEKKAAAIDAAADRTVEIVRRHREETNAARERLYSGLKRQKEALSKEDKVLAFEDLKSAKIAAEILAIIQRLDRINWGLESANSKPEIIIERSYGAK